MSYLFFMDESGHDHRNTPYEVHGGIVIHAQRLWSFIQDIRNLEQECFGTHLHDHRSEIKGAKLLQRSRFRWANQSRDMPDAERRKHALNFLNNSIQGRSPRRDEFTAYGQACLQFCKQVTIPLSKHNVRLFAAVVPHLPKPETQPEEYLRKDKVFLLERYFYFLEERQEMGLLLLDGSDKAADRKLVRRLEAYFTKTHTGRQRTQWIVPVPFFVESDMAYGVQVADLCIYCLNWGWRRPRMNKPCRDEIKPFAANLETLFWQGQGYRNRNVFESYGVFHVPDLYDSR